MIKGLLSVAMELVVRFATFLAAFAWGWSKRGEDINGKAHKADVEANSVRNRVRTDPDYRERVRREFDGE